MVLSYLSCVFWLQVRDIVEYAAERHITIVPEIELPGAIRAVAQTSWQRQFWRLKSNMHFAHSSTRTFQTCVYLALPLQGTAARPSRPTHTYHVRVFHAFCPSHRAAHHVSSHRCLFKETEWRRF